MLDMVGDLVGILYGVMYGFLYGFLGFLLYFQQVILSCILPGSLQINLFIHRQADTEPGAILIAFEYRRRRAVFPHGPQNLRHSRTTALGKIKFLEEFPDPPIAVAAADGLPPGVLTTTAIRRSGQAEQLARHGLAE